MKIHEKIRLARELHQWSQEEMAEKLEMSPSGYARIERGETQLSIPRLEQIAQIFNIDIFELLQKDKGIIIQLNESCEIKDISLYRNDSSAEIEQLKLIIKHQNQLLEQQTQELEIIKEMFALLKNQIK